MHHATLQYPSKWRNFDSGDSFPGTRLSRKTTSNEIENRIMQASLLCKKGVIIMRVPWPAKILTFRIFNFIFTCEPTISLIRPMCILGVQGFLFQGVLIFPFPGPKIRTNHCHNLKKYKSSPAPPSPALTLLVLCLLFRLVILLQLLPYLRRAMRELRPQSFNYEPPFPRPLFRDWSVRNSGWRGGGWGDYNDAHINHKSERNLQ